MATPIKHYHHHYRFSYTTSFKRHFTSVVIVIILITIIFAILLRVINPENTLNLSQISLVGILTASFNTLLRLLVAYIIALFLSIFLALFITSSEKLEKILLPIFDIAQSIPVLAFFPILVVAFIQARFLEGAAIFIITFAMAGNLVFSMIGGLKTIPEDIHSTARVFGAKGINKLLNITLPSIFPSIMTGSLLAWSQGWSIIIVAEALHTYIPNGTPKDDLFGLGSLLVDAFSQGKNGIFLASLVTMIVIIALLNYFIWQKLLHFAERFRFD